MPLLYSRRLATVAILLLLPAAASALTIAMPKKKPLPLDAPPDRPTRTATYDYAGWTVARASLHNHTIYSDARRTPEDLLELARRQGIAVLAITDHREGKFCAGKTICVTINGIERYGYAPYYEHLDRIRAAAQGQHMIVLRGAEVSSPYVYNTGKFPHLVINGQNNHFVVYNVSDPGVFDAMPARREFKLKPEPIPGDAPYQQFVSYMDERRALVMAAHPEEFQDQHVGPLHILTPPPVYNLLLSGLTGFAALPSGWHEKTAAPGGLWDTVLLEYLAGRRDKPLWAEGDSDYHGPHGSLASATTLFYLREFTEADVYAAMREGRMVALQGEVFQDRYPAEWWVSDGAAPSEKVQLGREVKVKGTPVVRFALDQPAAETRLRLICNGKVAVEAEGSEITYRDEARGRTREPAYYRVELIGPKREGKAYESETNPDNELFVNPIFVRFTP